MKRTTVNITLIYFSFKRIQKLYLVASINCHKNSLTMQKSIIAYILMRNNTFCTHLLHKIYIFSTTNTHTKNKFIEIIFFFIIYSLIISMKSQSETKKSSPMFIVIYINIQARIKTTRNITARSGFSQTAPDCASGRFRTSAVAQFETVRTSRYDLRAAEKIQNTPNNLSRNHISNQKKRYIRISIPNLI